MTFVVLSWSLLPQTTLPPIFINFKMALLLILIILDSRFASFPKDGRLSSRRDASSPKDGRLLPRRGYLSEGKGAEEKGADENLCFHCVRMAGKCQNECEKRVMTV